MWNVFETEKVDEFKDIWGSGANLWSVLNLKQQTLSDVVFQPYFFMPTICSVKKIVYDYVKKNQNSYGDITSSSTVLIFCGFYFLSS